MNTTRARAVRGPLRATAFLLAAGLGGTALLLAGCSQGSSGRSSGAASSASGGTARSAEFSGSAGNPAAPVASAVAGPEPARAGAGRAAVSQARRLIPAQSIIYTAQLTVQVAAVASAARAAAGIATAAGGYVSSQQESIQPGQRTAASASMQLKIPAAAYPAALSKLSTSLGTLKSVGRQATDVTQQVADVGSRVTSAQAAITQLRALLKRAGSVSGLLRVQEQINGQESALEALLAQQRALARETSYATVSLQLVSHHPKAVKEKKKEHGFLAGLSGGWRALRLTVSWLLTVLGAALPFTLLVALAGAIAYGGWRVRRRRSSPPPTAA